MMHRVLEHCHVHFENHRSPHDMFRTRLRLKFLASHFTLGCNMDDQYSTVDDLLTPTTDSGGIEHAVWWGADD